MRILIVNKYWYPRGGAEVVAMMTKQLLDEAGYETAVFSMEHEKNLIHSENFPEEIEYSKMNLGQKVKKAFDAIYNKDAKKKFEKVVKEFQPDVVHFHNIYHQLSFALLEVTKKYNIRTVMTLHDYKLISPNYSLFHHGKIDESILGKNYYRCLLNNCMESVGESIIATLEAYYREWKKYHEMIDVYISPSEFLKNIFVRAGWDEKKTIVIPNPVEIERNSRNFGNSGNYVAYIGRLSKEKGVEVLVKAAQRTPHIEYRIVGTGPEENNLKSFVSHNGIRNVHFEGWQTGQRLQELYEGARLLVVPSVWYENYPLGILEAKAKGKIVLASKIGGIPEMLSEEFLFEPGDSTELANMIKTWYDTVPEERSKIGSQLRQEVEKHNSVGTYLQSLINVYNPRGATIKIPSKVEESF